MHDSAFGAAAYNKFTPVTVSYGLGLTLLVIVNVAAGPFISRELVRFAASHPDTIGPPLSAVSDYWLLVGAFLVMTLLAGIASFAATYKRLQQVSVQHSTTDPPQKDAE